MEKVGILIFTEKIKERDLHKNVSFDNIKHFGFRKIISEIDSQAYEVSYISASQINEVDFVLVSIVSYYDAYNLLYAIKDIEVTSKIIIGGAGMTNPTPYRKKIWAACWGRGEGLINKILQGQDLPNVWYREKDPDLQGIYQIGQLTEFLDIDSIQEGEIPTHLKGIKEVHIGCRKKCYFCQYTWKNELKTDKEVIGYKSGLNDCENTIAETDWSLNNSYFITAIDGLTEKARRTVNRANITNKAIQKTFLKYFETSNQKSTTLKLYCVVGYPFEQEDDLDVAELIDNVRYAEKNCNNPSGRKLNVFLQCTHFVPMPFTPMEGEPVNLIPARDILVRNMHKFVGQNISLTTTAYITSNVSAIEQSIINRAKAEDDDVFKILLSKKYLAMTNYEKIRVIEQLVPKRLYGRVFGPIHNFIQNPFKIEVVKEAYYNNLKKFYDIDVWQQH